MTYGIAREVTTSASAEAAYAYLLDASREPEWNALVTHARRSFGDGGEGSDFRQRVRLGGTEHRVSLTLLTAQLPWIAFGGGSAAFGVTQSFTIRAAPHAGAVVSISAIYTFRGRLQLLHRLFESRLEARWDESCRRLQLALDQQVGGADRYASSVPSAPVAAR